jgi:hypothetical protein
MISAFVEDIVDGTLKKLGVPSFASYGHMV